MNNDQLIKEIDRRIESLKTVRDEFQDQGDTDNYYYYCGKIQSYDEMIYLLRKPTTLKDNEQR